MPIVDYLCSQCPWPPVNFSIIYIYYHYLTVIEILPISTSVTLSPLPLCIFIFSVCGDVWVQSINVSSKIFENVFYHLYVESKQAIIYKLEKARKPRASRKEYKSASAFIFHLERFTSYVRCKIINLCCFKSRILW